MNWYPRSLGRCRLSRNNINRREFIGASLSAGAAMVPLCSAPALTHETVQHASGRFRLQYAPHFGMFAQHAGDDPIDQIKFMADAGFAAVEDHGLMAKSDSLLQRIGNEIERHDMTMGLFVATTDYGDPTFASGRGDLRRRVLSDMQRAVDVAQTVGARWCTVVPGKVDRRLSLQQQMLNAIDLLKRCVEIVEPSGLTLLLEPLDHGGGQPGLFLHDLAQARVLCRAVNHPCCRVLVDVYHQRVAGRDPLQSLLSVWDELGYIQVGDYPGRKEPGTGTIDYRRLFSLLARRGYEGPVGMEHGNASPGKVGEQNVIAAYESHDPFK